MQCILKEKENNVKFKPESMSEDGPEKSGRIPEALPPRYPLQVREHRINLKASLGKRVTSKEIQHHY